MVNGKVFGDGSSMNAVLEFLRADGIKGWPVPLVNPIINPGPQGGEAAVDLVVDTAAVDQPVEEETNDDPAAPEEPPAPEESVPPAGSDSATAHVEGAVDDSPPEEPSAGGDEAAELTAPSEKKITAPKINLPEAAQKPTSTAGSGAQKRMSRGEKAAFMAKEEEERQARIKTALENRSSTFDPHAPKDHDKFEQFRKTQEKKKKAEEDARLEAERKIEQNQKVWKTKVISKKQADRERQQAEEAAAAKAAIKPTKVQLLMAQRRKAEEEAAAEVAQAKAQKLQKAKDLEAKKAKSKEAASSSAEERKAADDAYLESLPIWKRDKILRERKTEAVHRAQIEEERAKRLLEMRDDRETKEAEKLEARRKAEVAAEAQKKRDAMEKQAKYDFEAEELRKKLAKVNGSA
jgi:hypothetical protein